MAAVDDYDIGQHIGTWEVIDKVVHNNGTANRRSLLCRCKCGVEKVIRPDSLKAGRRCECEWKTQGGLSNSREYWSWVAMIRRCHDTNNKRYLQYGGRGITVCDRWLHSFSAFLEDMGDRPSGHSLDRVDVNGDYTKDNCRWSSLLVQGRNRTTTRYIDFNGERRPLTEWADVRGINPTTLRNRLGRGWSVEDAFTRPVQTKTCA